MTFSVKTAAGDRSPTGLKAARSARETGPLSSSPTPSRSDAPPSRAVNKPIARANRRAASQNWAPRVAEFALVLALAFVSAQIFGALIWPLPAPQNPAAPTPAATLEPADIANPFEARFAAALAAESTEVVTAVDTSLDVTLHGVWFDEDGGSAVIRIPGGVQKRFRVGEEICCGATLARVFAAHVLIDRGGAQEILRLPGRIGQAPTELRQATSAPLQTSPADVSAAVERFLEAASILPRAATNGDFEFVIVGENDGLGLSAFGVQQGDIIVSVNGKPAPKSIEQAEPFVASFRSGSELKLVVRRNGVETPVDVNLSAIGGTQ